MGRSRSRLGARIVMGGASVILLAGCAVGLWASLRPAAPSRDSLASAAYQAGRWAEAAEAAPDAR